MSAIAEFRPRAAGGWRRPSFGGLLSSVFAGEFQAAMALWVISIPVGALGFAPVGGQHDWMWLPWRIDGVWALLGAAGWAYLICALVAWFVAGSLQRSGVDLPESGWLRVAIAISGYSFLAHVPKRYRSMYTVKLTRFPYSVPAGKDLWLSAVVALRSCISATLSTLKLRYTVLGIATTANIPIQQPLTLSCLA